MPDCGWGDNSDGERARERRSVSGVCLASALAIEGLSDCVVFAAGTDGTDGPTDAAGAIADGTTVARGRSKGFLAEIFLQNNDSYNFFSQLGDLVKTGPTKTNLLDLYLLLVA